MPTLPNISSKKDLPAGRQVFVGLSGGVDSAVSAALLKQAGYDVTGVFIKVWAPDFLECPWREERRDAMRVAAHLGIPFLFFDFDEEYKKGVADYMIEEYRKGRTPNPDVMCNREIKFGAFWRKAREMGADYIATGHYAQVTSPTPSYSKRGQGGVMLLESADKVKDQSYFLWTLTQEDLSHTLFPIGHLTKPEVRALAKKFGLSVSDKKDSQGICFLGQVDLEEFLKHYISIVPGNVLDTEGNVIGTHRGALLYTLGERHGLEIIKKSPDSKPYYIVGKNVEKNTLTVSNNPLEIASRAKSSVEVEKINWITPPDSDAKLEARIRYRQPRFSVTLEGSTVRFATPQTADSGQSIVFYLPAQAGKGDLCVGGAVLV